MAVAVAAANDWDLIDYLSVLGVLLQIMNYQMDVRQSSNDDLLKELQHQDRDYLERILNNQKRIIELLTNKD